MKEVPVDMYLQDMSTNGLRSSSVDSYVDMKQQNDEEASGDNVSDISCSIGANRRVSESSQHTEWHSEESKRSFTPFEGVNHSNNKSVHPSQSSSIFDIDDTIFRELDASLSRRTCKTSKSKDEPAQDADPPRSPPDFSSRRKGSIERRMLLRPGKGGKSANESLANHTMFGTRVKTSDEKDNSVVSSRRNVMEMASKRMSLASLASFTSVCSTSGQGAEVGNLTFVTDLEMSSMCNNDCQSDDGDKVSYASLPPSAILGKGATSIVRLAWRKTSKHYNRNSPFMSNEAASDIDNGGDDTEIVPKICSMRNSCQPQRKQKSRRSVVRVISQPSSEDDSQASSKGDLVAVKLIQKSVLKQIKTMTKDANSRVTVRTAFDNIEKEIAMMKRLQHPNLVRLFEVIDSVENDKLYMVLEYVSLGEILSYQEGTDMYKRMTYKNKVKGLTPDGHFDERSAALYFVDVMHGVAYLHR